MNNLTCWTIAAGLALAMHSPARSAALPQTYAFKADSNMMGPMTVSVNRNGSREVIELTGSGGGLRLRLLYDFQTHRIFTVDLNTKQCTTQEYTSPYAPPLHDPVGGAEEMARQAGALKTIGREMVNGIPARVVEAPVEGQGKYKIWLEEKFGFPVKQSLVMGAGPGRTVFEIRQLSYAPPAAALFAQPPGCVSIAGSTNANGGSAEFTVGGSAQGQANVGSARPANPARQADANVLVGKWEFTGKDGAGMQWQGELAITKLEVETAGDQTNECDLNLSSGNAGKGMGGGCLYDSRTRKLSFEGGMDSTKFSFTAVLSPDGKSLTEGRWTDAAPAAGVWSAARKGAAPGRR